MVCYKSMSPLPSSASILCSTSSPFIFYALFCFFIVQLLCFSLFPPALNTTSCSTSLLPFMLCVSSSSSSLRHDISPSDYALRLVLPTCIILRETLCLFSILHVFHTSSHLPDHHVNSSSSMDVIQGSLASLAVILRIFCFSVSQNSSSSTAVTTSHFFGF
jgi:hypothetical protein